MHFNSKYPSYNEALLFVDGVVAMSFFIQQSSTSAKGVQLCCFDDSTPEKNCPFILIWRGFSCIECTGIRSTY
jgi:hypothetical protein